MGQCHRGQREDRGEGGRGHRLEKQPVMVGGAGGSKVTVDVGGQVWQWTGSDVREEISVRRWHEYKNPFKTHGC